MQWIALSSEDKELDRLLQKKYREMVRRMEKGTEHDGIVEVTDQNFQDVVTSGKPALLDFWAEWCAPCRIMHPILQRLHSRYGDEVVFGRLDVDDNRRVPASYSVFSIPTFILFKDGEPVERHVGAVGEGPLEAAIKKHTSN
jgi:thioredoxin 1